MRAMRKVLRTESTPQAGVFRIVMECGHFHFALTCRERAEFPCRDCAIVSASLNGDLLQLCYASGQSEVVFVGAENTSK